MRKKDRNARGMVWYKEQGTTVDRKAILDWKFLIEDELLKLHESHYLILQVIGTAQEGRWTTGTREGEERVRFLYGDDSIELT